MLALDPGNLGSHVVSEPMCMTTAKFPSLFDPRSIHLQKGNKAICSAFLRRFVGKSKATKKVNIPKDHEALCLVVFLK